MSDSFRVGVHHQMFHHVMVTRRKDRGLTQAELADACGVTTARISAVETLKAWPNPDLASAIASQLDCDTWELFPEWMRERIGKNPTSFTTEHDIRVESLDSPAMLALSSGESIAIAEEESDQDLLARTFQSLFATLRPRERLVLAHRYGLNGEQAKTLSQVGEVLGVTTERIRQIESVALRRLRHPTRAKALRSFLGGDDAPKGKKSALAAHWDRVLKREKSDAEQKAKR